MLLGFAFSELYEQIISLPQIPDPTPALSSRRSPKGIDRLLWASLQAIRTGIVKVSFYYRVDDRLEKQSKQYTGRSPRGSNGTSVFWPHSAQTAGYICRWDEP